jgi:enediyne polyketide synthase
MEAMAQVAAAVTGRTSVPVIERAEFLRPIAVPPGGSTTIRIAAVVTADDTVDVAIRSAETGFAADHFQARLRLTAVEIPTGPPDQVAAGLPPVALDPARDLYGDTLFQGGRFHRLRGFHRAAARHVDADVAVGPETGWFADYLPSRLMLGDPGARDALMHGNQVCVPDGTLLPAGIERIYPAGDRLPTAGTVRYCATERSRDGDTYVYDIAVRTTTGEMVERWEGLRLKAVRKKDGRGPWVAALLGSYVERTVGDLLGAQVAVAVEPDDPQRAAERRSRTAVAVGHAIGRSVPVRYRPDGRPEVDGDLSVSASHGAALTMCVAARGNVSCDVEAVAERGAAAWKDLLGQHFGLAELVAAELGEDADTAGTRVWSAIECLQKVGLPAHAPLTLTPVRSVPAGSAWAVFASGNLRVASLVTSVRKWGEGESAAASSPGWTYDAADPVAFAVLTDGWS